MVVGAPGRASMAADDGGADFGREELERHEEVWRRYGVRLWRSLQKGSTNGGQRWPGHRRRRAQLGSARPELEEEKGNEREKSTGPGIYRRPTTWSGVSGRNSGVSGQVRTIRAYFRTIRA